MQKGGMPFSARQRRRRPWPRGTTYSDILNQRHVYVGYSDGKLLLSQRGKSIVTHTVDSSGAISH